MRKVRIPGPNVPEVDNTGRPTTAWYAWKSNIDQILGTDYDALSESVTKDVFDSSAHKTEGLSFRQRIEQLEHAAAFDYGALVGYLRKDVNELLTNRVYYGQTTVNCGAIGTFNSITSQFVSVPTLPTNAKVNAVIRGEATADHTIDEIINDNIDVRVSGITASSGFTLNVLCLNGAIYGDYIIDWSYSNGY